MARKMSFTILQNQKAPLQVIKTRSSKSRKIDIFPKGLAHGFGPKKVIFATFVFKKIQVRNMSFMTFQDEKTPFQAIKRRSSKNQKIDRRGWPMVLVQKRPFFQLFFQAISARKMSFTILYNEKMPFQPIKTRSSKGRKIDIFPKGLTHGLNPKMAIFQTFF